jgi:hypothetical protein
MSEWSSAQTAIIHKMDISGLRLVDEVARCFSLGNSQGEVPDEAQNEGDRSGIATY